MHSTMFAPVFLLLALFAASIAAKEALVPLPGPLLTVRQANMADVACLDYERTANLSTIGANSTYRAAFIQASPVGTLANTKMLNAAVAKLPALTTNKDLNTQCGNWTEVAFAGAEANFTEGIIAQFRFTGNPQAIKADITLIPIVGIMVIVFGAVWIYMPIIFSGGHMYSALVCTERIKLVPHLKGKCAERCMSPYGMPSGTVPKVIRT
ncbi:hypothetical protein P154DRAFT_571798 [Amniculicola lignicola CBS 123094]|uniref:Uncharacterized protein n=1 Tax=Amniculicola lignicola CBS 123094 TaxID=1392246 RepID=A0A6A5WRU2_9PLEO|nr:hypothetical protein P154DRAFT_571798 [Amniculicola lignicola CBS 123094]